MNTNANATLCLDTPGSHAVTRGQLDAIPLPPALGPRHRPVRHADLVTTIERDLGRRGIRIESQQFGVARGGLHLFGAMTLGIGNDGGMAVALGFRSANDQSLAIQFVAGNQIFVCSNLILSGSVIALTRKHTSGLDLPYEVRGGLDRFLEQGETHSARIEVLKETPLEIRMAESVMLRAALNHNIVPMAKLRAVHDVYTKPPYEEYGVDTAWTLHNAFTHVLRDAGPAVRHRSTVALGSMFKL